MQTFLPYASFVKSAMVLDKKRCWKQVVEAKQILNVLEGKTIAWQNHPAVKMWRGYENSLRYYYNVFLYHCINVLNVNTALKYLEFEQSIQYPWWLGNEDFHRSHRSRLIEKNELFYGEKFSGDKGFNDGLYLWPDNDRRIFKIIKPKQKV